MQSQGKSPAGRLGTPPPLYPPAVAFDNASDSPTGSADSTPPCNGAKIPVDVSHGTTDARIHTLRDQCSAARYLRAAPSTAIHCELSRLWLATYAQAQGRQRQLLNVGPLLSCSEATYSRFAMHWSYVTHAPRSSSSVGVNGATVACARLHAWMQR